MTSTKAVWERHVSTNVVDLQTARVIADVRLCERALAGDADAAIQWLQRHGGPQWQTESA
jgi:hypothetical protein